MSPRRDRTGELIDEPDEPAVPRPRTERHSCDGGWIDRDADQPQPCLVCRPHLAPAELAKRNRAEGVS